MPLPTIEWEGDVEGRIRLVDQTLLPTELKFVYCEDIKSIWHAIKTLMVRGAPAIGIAAAMGVVLGIKDIRAKDADTFLKELKQVTSYLSTARPTAVNLFWGIARMERVARENKNKSVREIKDALLHEAIRIQNEDKVICRQIGENGAKLIKDGNGILTHCNAGGLATADYGTALAVLFKAKEQGKHIKVYADETRPLLQGARLTAWELVHAGIDVTLICDSMAAHVMKQGKVQCVIVGADRIAANGDTANKIGTYGVSILAKEHGIPFYVAAPVSTFDLSIKSGNDIPIEERSPEEITNGFGRKTAPEGVKVFNPAFDVTPAKNITAIITEKGVITKPSAENIQRLLGTTIS
ncbi:MAG: S-methyl-5-thioribose-1-phosphate isomerase [Candidatus Brocadia sp. AMX2]|uniref:Methylthioribose-1-phosphate isomerase n=1 Tax=Candidatus Brocadia sinica JPN1 TaxID=1197129 RepID=A0ABQ0JXU0_9BACT|nr:MULTISPECIES: S-methyl-5-thioribose-1-phosphate isomerase [Brocadia]KXK28836.1 MAG: putative translation initiation factor [Candidatus Brocadia sinica]MBC6932585.1 S-methyl-5-thioribose-1-phosphate isomerase [Candidatus Brocadia sp.]MBL1169869.1 S-methyl-5-thioribose-1-phosphate isomerase [Candidatus Brocadia sp. AMX1]NOG40625.1 S-methyl-5-thioribose-1-phosphate isomerase [Planctomycetota bacterium]KAA0244797.1 MAG: S-methyl-5-thioribose-1-phosphate isomerase [Candidatus Brocadia sp. AMX2]